MPGAWKGATIAIGSYAALALVAGALAGGGPDDRASASPSREPAAPAQTVSWRGRFPSLSALLYSRDDLSTARSLLQLSGLAMSLDRRGRSHTLFLPVNAAFSAQQGLTDSLANPGNAGELRRVMRHHVVRGRRGLYSGSNLPSLAGETLAVRSFGTRWWAGDARLLGGPLRFPGGAAYLVDQVLVPPGKDVTVRSSATTASAASP